MYRRNIAARERRRRIIEIFRQHGATTPEKAMTSAQLGLPPRFDEFMDRRGGESGVIVESSKGKYYLNEVRLHEMTSGRFADNATTPQGKEPIKIRCAYCRNLYDSSQNKCPYCGAGR